MNWKKVAIERLREYETRKNAVESIPEQIKALEMSFTAIRGATNDATAVKGGNGNKREDALIDNIYMRQELYRNLAITKQDIKVTEKALNKLTTEQYKILDRFYISREHGHVERLCDELCIERSRVYELKEEALKKFTLACYGIVEL